ncbi:flagellar hook-length control protein FliK [Hellea sp.]|nr:flagellar hook-length control protein FliK [Hellea sp.]
MNISPKLPDTLSQKPANYPAKADQDDAKGFQLGADKAVIPEPSETAGLEHASTQHEKADQDFLDAFSTLPTETHLPSEIKNDSTLFFSASTAQPTDLDIRIDDVTDGSIKDAHLLVKAPDDGKSLDPIADLSKDKVRYDLNASTKSEITALAVKNLAQPTQDSPHTITQTLLTEASKTPQLPPEPIVQETPPPEGAVMKDRPALPPLSKITDIAPNVMGEAPKLTADGTTALTSIANPASESTAKLTQAVTLTAPISTSHPALQTVAQTLVKAQETQSGISVRLDPPEMGRVFIDFKFEADRSVTAIIRSEVAETAILLKDKAEFFQQTLKDSGFDSINLSFQQNDPSKQNDFGHDHTEKPLTFFHIEHSGEDNLQSGTPQSRGYKLSTNTAIDIKL